MSTSLWIYVLLTLCSLSSLSCIFAGGYQLWTKASSKICSDADTNKKPYLSVALLLVGIIHLIAIVGLWMYFYNTKQSASSDMITFPELTSSGRGGGGEASTDMNNWDVPSSSSSKPQLSSYSSSGRQSFSGDANYNYKSTSSPSWA